MLGTSARLLMSSALAASVFVGCRAPASSIDDGGITGPPSDATTAPVLDGGEDAPPQPDTRSEPPVVLLAANIVVGTVAGASEAGSTDGVGGDARFQNPVGVVLDPDGSLFVTEYDGGRLRKILPGGQTSTLASGFIEPFALLPVDDGILVQSDRDPNGGKGPSTGTIYMVPLAGGAPVILAEGLGRPRGLARLLDGRVAISDRGRHTISILDLATKTTTLLAGSGVAGFVDGRGASARLNEPYGIAVLPDGSILVADSGNHVIRKVTLEGDVTLFAGEGLPGMKDDPDKRVARFDGPIDVAVDVVGNAFVSDGGNHRIRRVSSEGVVETVAGTGVRGFVDGIGGTAQFYGQEQIDVSPDGKTIFVSDGNGGDDQPYHRVRRISVP